MAEENISELAQTLVAAVHAQPGMTRAEVSRRLGISSGRAAELVAALVSARLLAEGPAVAGGRGRPTRRLAAHPEGPVVLAAALSHEDWRVEAVELGGAPVAALEGRHPARPSPAAAELGGAAGAGPEGRHPADSAPVAVAAPDPAAVLAPVAAAVDELRRRLPGRVRGLGISAPGLVSAERFVDAPALGWDGVDLWRISPDEDLIVADNDATLSALAEAWRGAAIGARLALHVRIDAGLGGALVEDGRLIGGARGLSGEFGHMPFGDPAVRCPCGAYGCWGTAVDGTALARALGEPSPADPASFTRKVATRAADGDAAAQHALGVAATALGRGLAGLTNALDPDIVTVGGTGTALLAHVGDAYRAGLMRARSSTPTPVVAAGLGEAGPLLGAAERVWQRLYARLP